MVTLLFSILVEAAKIFASKSVGELGKGTGRAAFDAIKQRLTDKHGVKSLPLIEDASNNPAFAEAIKTELLKPEIGNDTELLRLAESLRAALAELPSDTIAQYAVDIETLRSGGNLLIDTAEGVKANSATADGDIVLKNIKAPPGK